MPTQNFYIAKKSQPREDWISKILEISKTNDMLSKIWQQIKADHRKIIHNN